MLPTFHLIKAIYLSLARISRCNPLHPGGYDPVICPETNPECNESELTDPPPSFCDESTDLLPFSSKRPNERFCHANPCSFRSPSRHPTPIPLPFSKRFTKRTNPSATLRSLPTNFPSPAAEFVLEASFDGSNRFEQAKISGNSIFNRTIVAGDHINPGTGPTLFMAATFEDEKDKDSSLPSLQVFLPRWQVLRKGGSHFVIMNAPPRRPERSNDSRRISPIQ